MHKRWDFCFLQELSRVDKRRAFKLEDGHAAFVCPAVRGRSLCIVVHRRWAWVTGTHRQGMRHHSVTVRIDNICIQLVNVHLPPRGRRRLGTIKFLEALDSIDQCLNVEGNQIHIIGGDFNAELGACSEGDLNDERWRGPFGYGSRDTRGHILSSWLCGTGLTLSGSFWPCGATATRKGRDCSAQLDYFCHSETGRFHCTGFEVGDDAMTGKATDHSLLHAQFELAGAASSRIPRRQGGVEKVVEDMGLLWERMLTESNTEPTLGEFQKALTWHHEMLAEKRNRKICGIREELRKLTALRNAMRDPVERKAASKYIWKFRRSASRLRRQRRFAEVLESGRYSQAAGRPDIPVEIRWKDSDLGRIDWPRALTEWSEELYCVPPAEPLPDTVWEAHAALLAIDDTELVDILREWGAKGKHSIGEDGIGKHWLLAMPAECRQRLCTAMTAHLRKAWEPEPQIRQHLIPKRKAIKKLEQTRTLSSLATLDELMDALLHARARERLQRTWPHCMLGFRKGHSADEMLQTLVVCCEKASEWKLGLCFCKVDIAKAFDEVDHSVLWKALRRRLPDDEPLCAALLRSHAGRDFTMNFGEAKSQVRRRTRGVWQGRGSSPTLFGCVSADAWDDWLTMASAAGWGFRLDDTLVSALAWADDAILVATSSQMLADMLAALLDCCARRLLRILLNDKDKTQVCRNAYCDTEPLVIRGVRIHELPSLVVLGCQIHPEQTSQRLLAARIAATWVAWAKRRTWLSARHSPIHLRIRALHSILFPCLLWGTATICLTSVLLYSVRQLQRTILAQMLRLQRAEDETWDAFHLRRRLAIDCAIDRHKVKMWHEGIAGRKWSWAGHCARHQLYPMSLVNTRSVLELATMRELTGNTQGHSGDNRTHWWRWENDLESFARECSWSTWKDKVDDRDFWHQQTKAFITFLAPGEVTGDHEALWGDTVPSSSSSSGTSCVTGSSSSNSD